jgi:predicted nucleic acid-binding Zn ribbon protein
MTTYVYETIPAKAGEKPQYFEIKQSMKDAPLTKHPETGAPIRRVVLGGFGVLSSGNPGAKPAPGGPAGCGPGCGCH